MGRVYIALVGLKNDVSINEYPFDKIGNDIDDSKCNLIKEVNGSEENKILPSFS